MSAAITVRTYADAVPAILDFETAGSPGVFRGFESDVIPLNVWNDFAAVNGMTTARNLAIYPEFQVTNTSPFVSTGVEMQTWVWIRLNGVIDDPTAGSSGGGAHEYAAITTGWRIFGMHSPLILPPIPPRFMRQIEVKMLPLGAADTGLGSAVNLHRVRLAYTYDLGIFPLDVLSHERLGDHLILRGEQGKARLLAGSETTGGAQLKASTVADHLELEGATWLALGQVIKSPPFDIDWTTAGANAGNVDGSAAALAAGEQYDTLVVRDNSIDVTLTGYSFIKGDKDAAGSQVPPAPTGPEQEVIGYFARIADADGGGITTIRNFQVHEAGYLTHDATGTAYEVGAHIKAIGGVAHADTGERTDSVTVVGAKSNILVRATGALDNQTTAPDESQLLVGITTEAAGNLTLTQRRSIRRAPNLYQARRRPPITIHANGDDADADGEIWMLGHWKERNAAGALPHTVARPNGYQVWAHCTTLTTIGDLRMSGVRVSVGDWNGGTELDEAAATTEDTRVTLLNQRIWSRVRYAGIGANNPDVTISAPGALVANFESGIGQLWQGNGLPFHVWRMEARVRPLTELATWRFQAYKIPTSGARELLVDTGGLDTLRGTGGTGPTDGEWHTRLLHEDTSAGDMGTTLDATTRASVIDPTEGGAGPRGEGGQGLIAWFSDVEDIGTIYLDLWIHELVIP